MTEHNTKDYTGNSTKSEAGNITSPETEKKLSFEQAMQELENIVGDIEQGKVSLEESINKYEQGMKLLQYCRSILDKAEKRIETINKESDMNNE